MIEERKEEMQKTQATEMETQEAEGEAKPQVSIEDLQAEIERKEKEILRLQGLTRDLQKRGTGAESLDSLNERIVGLEERVLETQDMIDEKWGESTIEEPKTRKTRVEQFREGNIAAQRVNEPMLSPDVQRFLNYCDMADLHIDYVSLENCDPLVKEALGEGRGFREGLQYLKAKVGAKNDENIKNQFEQMRKEVHEQVLKEYGLTTSEAEGPSGPGIRSFTPEGIAAMPYKEFKEKQKDIDAAFKAGRIKQE